MLMRTDPFPEFDRIIQQVLGINARPSAMLMDAGRDGDRFVVEFDLPEWSRNRSIWMSNAMC